MTQKYQMSLLQWTHEILTAILLFGNLITEPDIRLQPNLIYI